MKEYKQPISVYFVYHPNTANIVKESVKYCYQYLQRDYKYPFSRFINIPLFYKTSLDNNSVPTKLETFSQKTIIFLLIDDYIIADDNWSDYYNDIFDKNDCVIPIALNKNALNFKNLSEYNFIRAFDFETKFYKENFLLNITNEIYRWVLNKMKSCEFGKDKSLRIFLSHTKDGVGEKIAEQLEDFINRTNLNKFFDAKDIAINYRFKEEIEKYEETSAILAINTDYYSSRYWCQKKVLYAKTNERPIVVLDCLNHYEDRRFPHASNISTLHLKFEYAHKIPKSILYEIILSILLETLRFNYAHELLNSYKKANFIPQNAIIFSRPPEFSDIKKMVKFDKKTISPQKATIFYPEPQLYDIEKDFFDCLGIKINTPINYNIKSNFNGLNIGISISNPEKDDLTQIGHYDTHLEQLSKDFARFLIAHNANLIYGGDLREGGFTEFIFNEAKILHDKIKYKVPHIMNYLAYPIYINASETVLKWKAANKNIAKMIEVPPPDDISDILNNNDKIISNFFENKYLNSKCFTQMRDLMIQNCDARIVAGGKCKGYQGIMPGILEEVLIAIEKGKPLYILGGFGGIASEICNILQKNIVPTKLTKEWQILNNANYAQFLDYIESKNEKSPDYSDEMFSKIKISNLRNGLSKEDNIKLFNYRM